MLLPPAGLAPCHTAIVKVPVTQALRLDHNRHGKMIITVTVTSAAHASDRARQACNGGGPELCTRMLCLTWRLSDFFVLGWAGLLMDRDSSKLELNDLLVMVTVGLGRDSR